LDFSGQYRDGTRILIGLTVYAKQWWNKIGPGIVQLLII